MSRAPDPARFLELVDAPVFILDLSWRVRHANGRARTLLGADPEGRPLSDFLAEKPDRVGRYLSQAARTTAASPGLVHVTDAKGAARALRADAQRLPDADGAPLVALRLHSDNKAGFRSLNRKIEELNAEIRSRRKLQASLQESLDRNTLLFRELQHRVKNNLQIVISLLNRHARAENEPRFTALIGKATSRLMAMSRAHEMMYRGDHFTAIPARPFVESLVEVLSASFGEGVSIVVEVEDDGEIPNARANAFALLLNELVTNAYKHGLREEAGEIRVRLEAVPGGRRLTVRDDGPGFPPELNEAAFGFTLLRGLGRQLGAEVECRNDNGAVCVVEMRDA